MIAHAHPVATAVVQVVVFGASIVAGVLWWIYESDYRDARACARRHGRIDTTPRTGAPRCLSSSDPSPRPRKRAIQSNERTATR